MTRANELMRPFAGLWCQQPVYVGSLATGFTWNVNPDNNEFEVVKVMPEGQEDVVVFSSRDKSRAEASVRASEVRVRTSRKILRVLPADAQGSR